MSLTRTTNPKFSAVDLGAVKDHCVVEDNLHDAILQSYLDVAIEQVETETHLCLAQTTWAWRMDRFPKWFDVPKSPLISVTSIQYADSDGATQTLASDQYTVDAYSMPGRIVPAYNVFWPDTYGHVNDVTVTFVAGYAKAEDIPEPLKHAILLIVAELFERREDATNAALTPVNWTSRNLMWPYRMVTM